MLEICIQTSYDQNVQLILKSYLPVVYGTTLRQVTLYIILIKWTKSWKIPKVSPKTVHRRTDKITNVTLHRKLKIGQHLPHPKLMNSCNPDGEEVTREHSGYRYPNTPAGFTSKQVYALMLDETPKMLKVMERTFKQ
jgi:hypothetical protein